MINDERLMTSADLADRAEAGDKKDRFTRALINYEFHAKSSIQEFCYKPIYTL